MKNLIEATSTCYAIVSILEPLREVMLALHQLLGFALKTHRTTFISELFS